MNKNYIIVLTVIGLLILGGIGYAVWNANQTPQVAIQNTEDGSTASNTNVTTGRQAGLPAVQTDSTTAPYISTVVVKGVVSPNGAPTTYWYEYGQTSALGSNTTGYSVGSGYVALYTPAYITGLLSNTNYYFRLVAQNTFGSVNGATYSFKTNATPAPTGTAPTTNTVAATNIERTTTNLNGRINPNGSETTFWFEYGSTSEFGMVTASQSAGSDDASKLVSISVSSLQPLTKYYFRLNAQNQFGTINGQILNLTTKGPGAATAPMVNTTVATAVTDASAKLNATVNPKGVATTYWFEYSKNSLLSNIVAVKTPEQSLDSGNSIVNVSATIEDLQSNTKYYFKVVAKNQYGTVDGDIVTFTTKK